MSGLHHTLSSLLTGAWKEEGEEVSQKLLKLRIPNGLKGRKVRCEEGEGISHQTVDSSLSSLLRLEALGFFLGKTTPPHFLLLLTDGHFFLFFAFGLVARAEKKDGEDDRKEAGPKERWEASFDFVRWSPDLFLGPLPPSFFRVFP